MAGVSWSRWGIRLVAATVACFLWLHAVTEHVYSMRTTARVQVHDPVGSSGEGSGVMVASEIPEEIAISVSGRGKDLLRLDTGAFTLHLRADGDAGTTRSYTLTTDMVQAREGASVVVERIVAPRMIEVSLDRREVRSVPVQARLGSGVREPYVLVGTPTIEPERVEVSGPSAVVRATAWVATDSVSLSGAQEDVDVYVELVAPAGGRCRVEPARVRLRADVQLLAQDVLQVPVGIHHADSERYRIEPARVRVKVKGGIDVIAGIDPERSMDLYVDAFDYQGGRLTVRHETPRLFEVVEISPAQVSLVER